MSKTKTRTKRAEVWSCLLDGDVICFHHSKAAAADCPCGRGTSRPSHLVEHLPGDVLLSREDAEELRDIVSTSRRSARTSRRSRRCG